MRNERKIHWRSWDKLTIAKKKGGKGFRDLRAFNLAIYASQARMEIDARKGVAVIQVFFSPILP